MRWTSGALPLHPLLFASYAVLFLYAENIHLVRLVEALAPLGWSLAGALLLLVLFSVLFRSVGRGALAASGVVVWFFGYGHIAGSVGDDVAASTAFVVWLAFVGAVTALAVFLQPQMPPLTMGVNVISAVLVVMALSTIVPFQLQQPLRASQDPERSGLMPTRTTQRDIYYLVFDRYGSDNALASGFGITDNDLPEWLAERGFQVAPGAYANYVRTTLSLASVLNLDYLDDVVAAEGPSSRDYEPLREMLNEHLVGRFLREQGYRYYHVGSWWGDTRSASIADANSSFNTTTEFETVLHGTTAMPALVEAMPGEEQPMPVGDQTHVTAARFQFREIPRVIGEPGPKFVMAHVLLPHDPYTFDAEGRYVPRSARQGVPIEDQFRAQLEYTNSEIKRIVERLLDQAESERPIIILQADEGPYPNRYHFDRSFDWAQATEAELQTKFGILNAFYVPAEAGAPAEPEPYPTMSSVNTFRLVLGRYFGLDLPLLADRVYTSRSETQPYDMTEVTDRLGWP